MDDTMQMIDSRARVAAGFAAMTVVAILSCLFYAGFGGVPLV